LHGAVTSDTWLNTPLVPLSKAYTPQVIAENKMVVLLSDFRKFASSYHILDVKAVQIGGRGWKPNKMTAGYTLRRQQELYRQLCSRKDTLLDDAKYDKGIYR
jgi:hypothetical protein